MSYNVTLLPGDGIGPEVSEAMRKCVDATGIEINWDVQSVGEHAIKECGTPLPDRVLESIRKNKVAIKGPIVTPVGTGFRSINVQLRQALDLYACVRPAKYYEGTKAVNHNVDLVIFRENTEDLYAGIEFELGEGETKKLIDDINNLQPGKMPWNYIHQRIQDPRLFLLKVLLLKGISHKVNPRANYLSC